MHYILQSRSVHKAFDMYIHHPSFSVEAKPFFFPTLKPVLLYFQLTVPWL